MVLTKSEIGLLEKAAKHAYEKLVVKLRANPKGELEKLLRKISELKKGEEENYALVSTLENEYYKLSNIIIRENILSKKDIREYDEKAEEILEI